MIHPVNTPVAPAADEKRGPAVSGAVVVWAVVLAAAMLSFFVHLLQQHVESGVWRKATFNQVPAHASSVVKSHRTLGSAGTVTAADARR